MAETSAIPEEARKVIGKDMVKPLVFEVEKGAIRRFAEAIEDPNPLYRDEAYAKKSRYGGIIAPPLMTSSLGLPELQAAQMSLPLGDRKNVMARGFEVEYFKPIKAGDIITVTCRLDDLEEQESRLGHMITIRTTRTLTNQKGEVVSREKMGLSRY